MKITLDLKDIDYADGEIISDFKDLIQKTVEKELVREIRRILNEEIKSRRRTFEALVRQVCDNIKMPNPQDIIDKLTAKDTLGDL